MASVTQLLSEMQAALLREEDPRLKKFAQRVDQRKAALWVQKDFISRSVLTRAILDLLPMEHQSMTLVALEALKEHPFFKKELTKPGRN